MFDNFDTIGETGLQFFGKMTASISHEINNVLAIINENAGLLEDFSLMSEQGMPIEPERLKSISQTVMKQVRRANGIIKNMNKFAHSADETITNVDLNDLLELAVALSARLAAMRSYELQAQLQESPMKIRTSPFHLMNLIWLCLDFAINAANDEGIVELCAQKTENGARIKFEQLKGLSKPHSDIFPAEREKNLLDMLKADMVVDANNNEIVINLSTDIDGEY